MSKTFINAGLSRKSCHDCLNKGAFAYIPIRLKNQILLNDQYYTHFHRDQKRQEFFRLRQWGKSVTEYETELRQLVEFVPEMAESEEYLCSKFEEGLNLDIREKMSVSGSQSYKEMVQ